MGEAPTRGAECAEAHAAATHGAPMTRRTSLRNRRNCTVPLLSLPRPAVNFAEVRPGGYPADFLELFDLAGNLGFGTSAAVRKAVRKADGVAVAIKCSVSDDEETRKFCRDEFEMLRMLDHPNIVKAFELIEHAVHFWLVMELCAGGDLSAHIGKEGRCEYGDASKLCRQLVSAVDYLHCIRIVHRDIKPENVLLNELATELKLADFNSATKVGGRSGMLLSSRCTPAYAAPEVRLDLGTNELVDIWSCGICTFYMLTATVLFSITDEHILESWRRGKLPPLDWMDIAADAQEFITACLTVVPQARPSAAELLRSSSFVAWQPQLRRARHASLPDEVGNHYTRRAICARTPRRTEVGGEPRQPNSS
eukprot:NODE_540_length_1490_cov_699.377003.p1 GENE.NODE_540_length_1490_cov_699.377003~~NODE_540_length_1490_cov_699.377003.p1  ORF type:complete len:366 (-),score=74.22 NODE_540_length_1490_cov_699.377003:375-1472(-)